MKTIKGKIDLVRVNGEIEIFFNNNKMPNGVLKNTNFCISYCGFFGWKFIKVAEKVLKAFLKAMTNYHVSDTC